VNDPAHSGGALESLEIEHANISRALDLLEPLGRGLEPGMPERVEPLRSLLAFFDRYADHLHHVKEEQHLFPALEDHEPEAGEALPYMLREHDNGRHALCSLRRAIDLYQTGEEDAHLAFRRATRAYVHLLRAHIKKEDEVLFPMALRRLSEDALGALQAAFTELDEHARGWLSEALEELSALEGKWLVARP
jgi:hemerythrin-like domain-containing protein